MNWYLFIVWNCAWTWVDSKRLNRIEVNSSCETLICECASCDVQLVKTWLKCWLVIFLPSEVGVEAGPPLLSASASPSEQLSERFKNTTKNLKTYTVPSGKTQRSWFAVWLAVSPFRITIGWKIWDVPKNLGNSHDDGYWNFPTQLSHKIISCFEVKVSGSYRRKNNGMVYLRVF